MESHLRPVVRIAAVAAILLLTGCYRVRVVDRVENPTSGEKPLDLVAHGAPDDNGLPDSPRWQHQWDGNDAPDPQALCTGADGKLALERCTSQKPALDLAAGFADVICSFGTAHDIRGHANWWPVTYRGNLFFDEASLDLDYTFSFRPEGDAALVASNRGALHVEFDSSETVAFFDTPWWNDLRDAADRGNADARAFVNGQQAVLTGLFGLDCEHECHAESHPVYLFALQARNEDDDDTWAFFVRNWGNEGFCSRYMHVLPLESVAFRIPWRCGATSVALGPGTVIRKSRSVRSEPRVKWAPNEGVVVEVDLPRADPGGGVLPRVHGEVQLVWTMGAPCPVPRRAIAPRPAEVEEENSAERRLEALAPPAPVAREAVPRLAREAKDDVPTTPTMTRLDRLPAKAPATARARTEEAKAKLQRDEALLRARCQAARERAGRAPPECEPVLGK